MGDIALQAIHVPKELHDFCVLGSSVDWAYKVEKHSLALDLTP